MANRLSVTIALSILAVSCGLTACGDDDDVVTPDGGGAGGEAPSTAGTKTGGSSSGGSDSKAGGGGVPSEAGSGGAIDTGGGGAGGVDGAGATGQGGALGGAGADGLGGSGGEGGQGELVYACGKADLVHTVCSALKATVCADEYSCADCVLERAPTRDDFTECAACLAEFERYWQCPIDAFESHHPEDGVQCFEGYGPDINDACGEYFGSANACVTYLRGTNGNPNPCPETWPLQ